MGEPYCSEPEKRKTIIFPFFLSITNMRNKHTLTQNAALGNGDINLSKNKYKFINFKSVNVQFILHQLYVDLRQHYIDSLVQQIADQQNRNGGCCRNQIQFGIKANNTSQNMLE